MLQTIESVNTAINNFIWGVPAMICIIGVVIVILVGSFFTSMTKGVSRGIFSNEEAGTVFKLVKEHLNEK